MINKTFTKKDLLEIIEVYEMDIEDPSSLSKKEIQIQLEDYLENNEIQYYTLGEWEFETSEDLLKYLENEKPNTDLNYREKGQMITLSKKLIHYCRNGFSIAFSEFNDIDEIYQKALEVANHGDIPTCRRAIKELNKDSKIRNKIEIVISDKIQKELEQKKIDKKSLNNNYKFTKKYIVITFD
tara:strand:+ start:82 stop:630 length:549 start_codon:yes stop_codon:yes gene_type:complete